MGSDRKRDVMLKIDGNDEESYEIQPMCAPLAVITVRCHGHCVRLCAHENLVTSR